MTLLGSTADYTDKDFDALNARLRNLIRRTFPEWTDEAVANFGNMQVEMFAFVGDVLTKYQDNQAGEAFVVTAQQRSSLLAAAKGFGYVPRGRTASAVDLMLTITSGAPVGSVSIPIRTKARTESVVDPVSFEIIAAASFTAGSAGPIVVSAENAEQRNELFAANGRPAQELTLAGTPFLDSSLALSASNGVYIVVENFLDSTSSDRHVTVSVDQNDRARVRFGDGRNGALPSGTISATYKIGGGASGKVEPGAIRKLEGSFFDSFGNPVVVEVTNAAASTDALGRQTNDQIRLALPVSLRVLNRTVAREDYEINAKRVAGVSRALMLTSDQYTSIGENQGILFIVPPGGGVAPSGTLDAVLEMVTITYPRTLTFALDVRTAVYLEVDVTSTVYLSKGADPAVVRASIEDRLARAFAIDPDPDDVRDGLVVGIDFGWNLRDADGELDGSIAWSTVFDIIKDTPGVRKLPASAGLLLASAQADLPIDIMQFPILGTITLINGDTGAPL